MAPCETYCISHGAYKSFAAKRVHLTSRQLGDDIFTFSKILRHPWERQQLERFFASKFPPELILQRANMLFYTEDDRFTVEHVYMGPRKPNTISMSLLLCDDTLITLRLDLVRLPGLGVSMLDQEGNSSDVFVYSLHLMCTTQLDHAPRAILARKLLDDLFMMFQEMGGYTRYGRLGCVLMFLDPPTVNSKACLLSRCS